MPDYQWKLTILERNLSLSNWTKLMPEAQERMLEEADELMGDLPLPDRQQLLALIATLQNHVAEDFQRKITQILSHQSSADITNAPKQSIQNNTLSSDFLQLVCGHYMKSVS